MPDRTGVRLYDRERAAAELPVNRDRDRAQALAALTMGEPTLYALRLRDGTIKIGCSSRLHRRRSYFGPHAEVLGFMPGDFDDEAAIHDGLRHDRAHGREFYYPTPAVFAVINEMRDRFNLPHLSA